MIWRWIWNHRRADLLPADADPEITDQPVLAEIGCDTGRWHGLLSGELLSEWAIYDTPEEARDRIAKLIEGVPLLDTPLFTS